MPIFEVWPSSTSYHGSSSLSYSHDDEHLPIGSVVVVPLRNKEVLGLVAAKNTGPSDIKNAKAIIRVLSLPPLPDELLRLHRWLTNYYGSSIGMTTQLFTPSFLGRSGKTTTASLQPVPKDAFAIPPLTDDQRRAVDSIFKASAPSTHLIHGITGSGKTRVYGEIIADTLGSGRSVIVLTPEIGLSALLEKDITPHAINNPVLTLHSNMTQTQRRTIWEHILTSDKPVVLIGPRSALFAPIRDIGLIVIDEQHDSSYKQNQAPYYHAVRVAAMLNQFHKARLVMGSATPSITDYYLASRKPNSLVELPDLAIGHAYNTPKTSLIDIKEPSNFTRSSLLSNQLIDAVSGALAKHKQSLVFLNRRGTARVVACSNCSWQAECPRCLLPVTYHHTNHTIRCHICGWSNKMLSACPACGTADILLKIPGTKAVEEELVRLFPSSRIKRFDSDNTKPNKLEIHAESIRRGDVDIIVGTQVLIKGFDIPRLAVLGIVNADTALSFPDYTAVERTFQQITQAVGRVGRGHGDATVIVQTHNPKSSVIKNALSKDWDSFYSQELSIRQTQQLPPFSHILKVECLRATSSSAQSRMREFAESIAKEPGLTIRGPAPAFRPATMGKAVWQIIVASKKRSDILDTIQKLPSGFRYDIDPLDLL